MADKIFTFSSRGPQGAQGEPGAQGSTGPQGAVGAQGSVGAQGDVGVQGASGSQGPQGYQGSIGTQGSTGAQGAQGYQGATGPQGSIGPQGSAGAQGATGAQGAQGVQGPEGPTNRTGFTDPANVVSTYNSTTKTFTLTGNVEAYYDGELVASLVSGWTSSALPSATPTESWFLYYGSSGFEWSTTPWNFYDIQIGIASYDSAGNFRFAVREVHGLVMDQETHREFHDTIGTYRRSGGALSGYVIGSTTANDRRPLISSALVYDEDLPSTITALATRSYTYHYLNGTDSSVWGVGQSDIFPNATQGYWNQFTGGAWQQTALNNNEYTCMWLVAIPVTADTQSQAYRYVWIQGQSVSSSIADIRATSFNSINLGDITSLSPEYVAIAQVIIQETGSNNWTVAEVNNLTGTRALGGSPAGSFLSTVSTDGTTIMGDGTVTNPLYAVLTVGPQGPQGYQGATGADSTVPGPQGAQGAQGPQGYQGADGGIQIADAPSDGSTYARKDATWVSIEDVSGALLEVAVEQTSHGFSVLNAVYDNGTVWVKAQADNPDTLATHVVIEVIDSSNFVVSNSGRAYIASHGLTPGQFYFTSDATAGAVTSTEPADYSNPMFRVVDADYIDLVPWRPMTTTGGDIGPQGPQGYQGSTGSQGAQGVQGSTGAQGPQGAQGAQGFSAVQIVTALPATPDVNVVYIVTG